MSIGSSGRIVIEVELNVKRQLYALLARDGMTLKDWFLREANAYFGESQLSLELNVQQVLDYKSSGLQVFDIEKST